MPLSEGHIRRHDLAPDGAHWCGTHTGPLETWSGQIFPNGKGSNCGACQLIEVLGDVTSHCRSHDSPSYQEHASEKREWFEHRHTWGATVRSSELQAAPWLTSDPVAAIGGVSRFMGPQ